MKEILNIKDLVIHYKTTDGLAEAVNGVNLSVTEGMSLGLVGETGAGKTTLAKGILRIVPNPPGIIKSGEILFKGKDILKLTDSELRSIRGKEISMIFQDPMTSLNPVMPIGDQIAEVIKTHYDLNAHEVWKKTKGMLEMVGISGERAREYAYQFSGGMKQRVVIAIALACNPAFLIADEPTTALDVTIQAQLLELMRKLRQELGTSMLMITHDFGVVAQNCDHVAIMYAGEIIEYGDIREIFKDPKHPYTKGLFASIPRLDTNVRRLLPIEGLMPDPMDLPYGCRFHPRCRQAGKRCTEEHPPMLYVGGEHSVRCFADSAGGVS